VSQSESTPSQNVVGNVERVELVKPLSQQFFDLARSHRTQARELRARTPSLTLEAAALDVHAAKLEDKSLEIATQSEIKRESVKFEKWLKEQEHYLAWRLENSRSIISLSQSAIRVIATANAGAAVALLAFLGNALAKDAHVVAAHFAGPLLTFAIGLVVAVLVGGASYVTQLLYGAEDPKNLTRAKRLHWLAAVLWFAATGAFAVGCVETYFAVRSVAKDEGASMVAKDADRGSVQSEERNAPPPVRPASDPPAVKMPIPQPPAPKPASTQSADHWTPSARLSPLPNAPVLCDELSLSDRLKAIRAAPIESCQPPEQAAAKIEVDWCGSPKPDCSLMFPSEQMVPSVRAVNEILDLMTSVNCDKRVARPLFWG
jgi:hypothetical protein